MLEWDWPKGMLSVTEGTQLNAYSTVKCMHEIVLRKMFMYVIMFLCPV